MGAVCSAGMVEGNAELGWKTLGFSGKLKKENSFMNRRETFSDSRSNGQGKKKKKQDTGFSHEFDLSSPTPTGGKQVTQRGSFLGKASERAVEVLDTLGSGMSKLNTSNGFGSGMASRGNKISILAFEVANTLTKGSILFQSLSEENIQFLMKDILQSEGVQQLVSTDMKELISLAEADKRQEFNVFSREVARFGNMCKDPQWHNLDRYFLRLDLDVLSDKQFRAEAEKTMQELTSLVQNSAELYHELNAYERFEQDYQHKIKEMESLNLPLKGESITIFQSELKQQKKLVMSLKKKSLWSRNLEEIVEKLVDIVTYIHQAICEFLGNHGAAPAKYGKGPERLGEAGLALHYANIINQINMIASRPTSLPPNTRDTLYYGLPNNIKSALPSRLQTIAVDKEYSITQTKAEMEKTLQWLVPFATNTIKAHQGFGWVGEWANNTSNDFGDSTVKESSNLIRLQTLYYVDKQKIDVYIIELLAWLHHLISHVRSRQNALKSMPTRSPPKGHEFQSKMRQFLILSVDPTNKPLGTQLSQEDRRLLENVIARRRNPGVSKSEELGVAKKREPRDSYISKSAGNSPVKEFFGTRHILNRQNYNVLDIMDGLR
ncbi:protein PSK SIMULATOR 2-like [Gastrolobium bilobum]|uniref:protein PSK SIMULATOR 2-like n=1 Tax=Gastrolobium bilobum TaxID=150636 RepID=UPI002AB2D582|nr:protein PSK SIMULATOR 2-like [Gastrolobium bilobum]XP_061373306.1 protein PSK SIMULATOR 2-like [Gastrolobium bilobum]